MSKSKLPPEVISEIRRNAGKKGGTATRDKHGKEHFAKIGAMGGAAPQEKTEATAPQAGSDGTPEA
jgi:hypothetical protein